MAHLGKSLERSQGKTAMNLTTINPKDCIFLTLTFALCAGICAFTFWLGFPGYIYDTDTFRVLDFVLEDFGPPMNTLFIWLITLIFGKHTFYLFLLNLITLYLGIYFLIAGFYLRYKSIFALTPIFIAFIGNIYLSNFISMNYVLMANFIFCAYSGILFLTLAGERVNQKIRVTLWILIFALLFLGLLWRHNAIFSAFPAFFIIVYLFLKNRALDSKEFAKRFVGFIALSAVICLAIVVELPKRVPKKYDAYPSNPIFLLQIAGACVPSDDSSCFKDEWYYFDGRKSADFSHIKIAYNSNSLVGDFYSCGWNIIECGKLNGMYSAWLAAILKHPLNFLAHEARFFKAMWWQNPRYDDISNGARSLIKNPKRIQAMPQDSYRLNILSNYPRDEWGIAFNPLRERIYAFAYNNLPVFNHALFVATSFVLLTISGFLLLWWRKKELDKSLIVFVFATALTSFASAVIIAGMTIVAWSRYMSPVAIFSVIALTGFVALWLEICTKKARIWRKSKISLCPPRI